MPNVHHRLPSLRWAALWLLLLLLVAGGPGVRSPSAVSGAAPAVAGLQAAVVPSGSSGPGSTINTTLTVGNTSANLSGEFWGSTVNNEVRMFRGETNAVNATPARVLVWPGAMAGEDYDPITDTHYDTYSGAPVHAQSNETQFVTMCKAIHCTAIVQVPAEIDNPALAEQIVNYTERNLRFIPAFWMIGNEPELWSHWQVPWKDWPTQYTTGPTPTQFANEVLTYVKVIRQVDNSTPILGLPASGCACSSWTFDQWIAGVLKVTGPKIQAVAFHEYPAGWLGTGDGSLHDFYGTLQGPAGIPVRMAAANLAVRTACPGCNVSVFISELGAALSWSAYGPYAIGFSGALSIASQITQAMDVNLTNIDLFATELATTNSWFGTTGIPRADYALYTSILDHLGTEAIPVNLSGMDHTIYGIDTLAPADQGRRDLLVMNDNITHPVAFAPKFAGTTGSAPVEAWTWNGSIHNTAANGTTWVEPYTPTPLPQLYPDGLPASFTLPPQSLVLFESYPSGATYVRVNETGVPNGTAWYAQVGSRFYTTTASNLSLLLPSGSYPVGSVGIPLPIGGKELVPGEQLGPHVPSPFNVTGRFANETVTFTGQWRTDIASSPTEGGTIEPATPAWWNDSRPLSLIATPAPGFAFVGWSGWGPGSVNSTQRSITLTPAGRLTERARFIVGNPITLWETGLKPGTNWSATVRGLTSSSTNDLITVFEALGKYGVTINPIPGYRSIPKDGAFTVDGSFHYLAVKFFPIEPAPSVFPVTFRATGLPGSPPVSITVRGLTETTGGAGPDFELLNGSYAFQVGSVPGYHPTAALKVFFVGGGPLTVLVPFVPTLYPARLVAVGAKAGMDWSLDLNGTRLDATSSWVSTALANGSYPYTIDLPSNYSASPRTGVLVVRGTAAYLNVFFSALQFTTWFEGIGLASPADWTIRFGSLTQSISGDRSSFVAPNGTYTFDVHAPRGYYAVPSHGTLTVAGTGAPTPIRFYPSSERPSAALVAALSSGALMTSVWIGASIFAGFAAVRGLRRRGG